MTPHGIFRYLGVGSVPSAGFRHKGRLGQDHAQWDRLIRKAEASRGAKLYRFFQLFGLYVGGNWVKLVQQYDCQVARRLANPLWPVGRVGVGGLRS
jgi:hypothetical protein